MLIIINSMHFDVSMHAGSDGRGAVQGLVLQESRGGCQLTSVLVGGTFARFPRTHCGPCTGRCWRGCGCVVAGLGRVCSCCRTLQTPHSIAETRQGVLYPRMLRMLRMHAKVTWTDGTIYRMQCNTRTNIYFYTTWYMNTHMRKNGSGRRHTQPGARQHVITQHL